MHSPLNPSPQPCDDIRANVARLQRIWEEALDEPQDPQTAERIATSGKRKDRD
jgi:hypothetical protein